MFDLTVHKRDKSGRVTVNPYKLHIGANGKVFERPPGSGIFYQENGDLAPVQGKPDAKVAAIYATSAAKHKDAGQYVLDAEQAKAVAKAAEDRAAAAELQRDEAQAQANKASNLLDKMAEKLAAMEQKLANVTQASVSRSVTKAEKS